MAVTPAGTPYVETSDLLANYPGVSLALANHIDENVGGLVQIVTQSFTAQGTVIFNNCFTSTYSHYKIMLDTVSSVANGINIRMRVGGADSSAASYSNTSTTSSDDGGPNRGTSATQTLWSLLLANRTSHWAFIEMFNPQRALSTQLSAMTGSSSAANPSTSSSSNFFNAATVFDGLSFITTTGTITGTVRIYGYRNS